MGKVTQAEIEDLRKAKKTLEALQTSLTADGSAKEWMGQVESAIGAFGGSSGLDGHGEDLGKFVDARTAKTSTVLDTAAGGVQTAIGLLDKTIQRYEAHEKHTKDAADKTPAGQSTAGGPTGGRGV